MRATKIPQILSVIVLAGLITWAVVNDVSSRKVMSVPEFQVDDKTDRSTWSASPEPLFDKNNEKLKPFMGLMSGSIALQYQGPQQNLAVSFDYWNDGVKKNTSAGMSMSMMENDKDEMGNYHFEGDFVYSFKDRQDPNGVVYSELEYAIIGRNGYYSSAVRVDKPAGIGMTGEMKLQQSVRVPQNESIVVWGLQGTDKQSMLSYSNIAETLKIAKWAMTVRLGFIGPNEEL
ncbi:hypothetical protein GC096_26875 [Paenibacillus sp. LMG 31461]|uniref:Uncharacterized protein n=1 Tax=Paenibacillus plantarum TaxID=2654975 RepID=A0ABX1XGV7_9BACL|nr:hypothetical protein [Paenibacillus plantarum]NOU67652.1 hypothetical protein [Paenibacillus plantarum]